MFCTLVDVPFTISVSVLWKLRVYEGLSVTVSVLPSPGARSIAVGVRRIESCPAALALLVPGRFVKKLETCEGKVFRLPEAGEDENVAGAGSP